MGQFNINNSEYKNHDKNKQKQLAYQNKQEVFQKTGEWPGRKIVKKSSEAWDEAKKRREIKKENRKKRQETKKVINEQKANGVQVGKKRKSSKYTQEDLDELAKDIAAIKKFKKNKISKEELDNEMGFDEGEEIFD